MQINQWLCFTADASHEMVEFIHEKLVALEVGEKGFFYQLTLLIVAAGRQTSQVDPDLAFVPDNLQAAGGGTLDVVLVQVDRYFLSVDVKFHERTGDVFDVNLQAA